MAHWASRLGITAVAITAVAITAVAITAVAITAAAITAVAITAVAITAVLGWRNSHLDFFTATVVLQLLSGRRK